MLALVSGVHARSCEFVTEVIGVRGFAASFSDTVCRDVGGGSGAAADGESSADEFTAGDGGVSASGVCRGGEACGVAEDEAEIVAADSEVQGV